MRRFARSATRRAGWAAQAAPGCRRGGGGFAHDRGAALPRLPGVLLATSRARVSPVDPAARRLELAALDLAVDATALRAPRRPRGFARNLHRGGPPAERSEP